MTVTYSLEVSRTRLGGFAKLLLRWRGSIYRLMYREMIIFTVLYYAVAVLYRYVLPDAQKRTFEEVSRYCREFTDLIPITFVMGFYVAVVVGRWWQQYLAIPWPDRCCLQIASYIQGNDERGRLIRRGLARYLNLLSVLTMQATSTVVRKRFPSVEHLLQSGLMTEEEREELGATVAPHGNWWIPASWFCQLAMQARKEGRIHDDLHLKSLIDDALSFRGNCGLMWSFDWISVPLVYTQVLNSMVIFVFQNSDIDSAVHFVFNGRSSLLRYLSPPSPQPDEALAKPSLSFHVVTLSVYCFFAACLFGRQYLQRSLVESETSFAVDYYVPVFTFFQFFFYMGWLKVAEQLINPYGEDDDDFELSWIIDRNLQVSYLVVDGLYQKYPKLVRDMFWDKAETELPYTEAAVNFKTDPFLGSTMTMNFAPREKGWHINPIPEEARSLLVPDKIRTVGTGTEARATDEERADTKPASATAPCRHCSGTPRAVARPKFLSGLLKGESRSALNSRCASKSSINSIGNNATSRQKSPTPTSTIRTAPTLVDPAVTSRVEIDQLGVWCCGNTGERPSQLPQRQCSVSENAALVSSSIPQHTVQSAGTQIPVVTVMGASQPELNGSQHQTRRVKFQEPSAEAPTGEPMRTYLQLLLLRPSASAGTLISDSGHGGSCCQFDDSDPPTGSESAEQLTVNSRTFLLRNNKP